MMDEFTQGAAASGSGAWSNVGAGVLWVVAGLVVLALVLLATLVLVMRTKDPRALAVVRRFNQRFNNPRMLRTAGRPGSALTVIRHVGRRSGTSYETPIGVFPMEDDFLAILSYGSDTDWLRNARAAGSAELALDGQTYRVTAAEIIGRAEALPYVPSGQLPFVRLFGVTEFLVLRRAAVTHPTT
jgi:deazaflavin-dependent oxidoreductase (nitroreductase family)